MKIGSNNTNLTFKQILVLVNIVAPDRIWDFIECQLKT